MGFDISYHPIKEQEMQAWYFDLLQDDTTLEELAKKHQMDDFYIEKYRDTLDVAKQTPPTANFDKTHGYYIAVIQGFFRTFFYTRGSAYSFLMEEHPLFKKYTTPWQEVLTVDLPNPIHNAISENYSSGVYMSAANVVELLSDYHANDSIKKELDDFYSHGRINVFINALTYAKEHNLGLLEATEVIEPNPLDLNESTCYSNLFNCDLEGALLYEAAVIEQLKEIETDPNLTDSEILSHTEYVKTTVEEVAETKKKGFWQNLFGK
ncbi:MULTISPECIES: hypothetical protein [unclassified Myroides]|uniref:hypothetical protein n=1 Tax=unclassified Myroides TaxID=2642485 RepID=UPI003D2F5D10